MDTTLGQSLAAFVSAGIGAALAVSIGVSHRQLCALISFAAGTLLSASVFHILPEASAAGLSPLSLFMAVATGYGLFFLISKYVFHMCPACAASHFEEQEVSHFKNVFFLLAIALTIHSAMDGIAIAVSPHMAERADHSIFFTIAIHKLPEGLALCALLMKSGHEKKKALIGTLLLETSTLLGWAIGSYLLQGNLGNSWLDLLMVHIAGGFIYLAVHATINEIRDHSPKLILTFFLLGFVFMALVR
jgi:zinc transporter, ZIP family